jgi:RNA polymerase sigma factor (sigma-70 family)
LIRDTIRLPLEVAENRSRLVRLNDEFLGTRQRLPTTEEVEEHLVMPSSRRQLAEHAAYVATSLDRPVSFETDTVLGDLIAGVDPTVEIDDAMSRKAIRRAVDALPQPYRTVVELRFGIDDDCPRSLRQVAAALKMSQRTVKRIELQALAMLRLSPILAAA